MMKGNRRSVETKNFGCRLKVYDEVCFVGIYENSMNFTKLISRKHYQNYLTLFEKYNVINLLNAPWRLFQYKNDVLSVHEFLL